MKKLFLALLSGVLLVPAASQAARYRSSHAAAINTPAISLGEKTNVSTVKLKVQDDGDAHGGILLFAVKPGTEQTATFEFTPKADGNGTLRLRSIKSGAATYRSVTVNGQPLFDGALTFDGTKRGDKEYEKSCDFTFECRTGEKIVLKFDLIGPAPAAK